jgi:hypothetical protein
VIFDNVGEEKPVVGTVTHLQVVKPIHVGAHLLGRGDLLDDPVDAVMPQARLARVGMAPVDLVIVVVRYCRNVPPGNAGMSWSSTCARS